MYRARCISHTRSVHRHNGCYDPLPFQNQLDKYSHLGMFWKWSETKKIFFHLRFPLCFFWVSWAISGDLGLSPVIPSCIWSPQAILGYLWLYLTMIGYVWVCLSGIPWLSLNISCHRWLSISSIKYQGERSSKSVRVQVFIIWWNNF